MVLEKIYESSPILFQNVMTSMAGIVKNKKRYGKHYYKHRKFLEEFDSLSYEKKEQYQYKKMMEFIEYTNKNSDFYKKKYAGIDLSTIKSIHDLKVLPIIDKETIRENIDEITTIDKKDAILSHTGGTTGKSLTVLSTTEDSMERMAMLDHFKSRVGFEHLKMKRATFNGKHIVPPKQRKKNFWRYNVACKQMIYSSFHLSEENLEYYVKSLNSFKPHALDGFFMAICDVASYIERHNIPLKFEPIAVFPTSETVTESGRELVERVFKCKVYDQYASSEGAPFVTECKHNYLHVEMSTGVFEHMSSDNNEVLVTSFNTHGTPLIRYRIGDSMTFEGVKACPCGLETPVIGKIQGRKLDYLLTPDGAKINLGNVANLFKNMPNSLIRSQVIQRSLDQFEVLLEIDKNRYQKEHDDLLIKEFTNKFGVDIKVSIKHVDVIPRAKSGKYKLVINELIK